MRLADPDVANNNNEYQKIAKSLAELEEIYQTYQRFKECEAQLDDAKGDSGTWSWLILWPSFGTESHGKVVWEWVLEMAKDAAGDREMAEMAAEEANILAQQVEELEEQLKVYIFLWNLTSSN